MDCIRSFEEIIERKTIKSKQMFSVHEQQTSLSIFVTQTFYTEAELSKEMSGFFSINIFLKCQGNRNIVFRFHADRFIWRKKEHCRMLTEHATSQIWGHRNFISMCVLIAEQ